MRVFATQHEQKNGVCRPIIEVQTCSKIFIMKNKWLIVVGMIFLLQACIPSLHPLYTADTLVFEETFLGNWSDGPDRQWNFERGDNINYEVTYIDKGEAVRYEVHLVKLGTNYFLDFYFDDEKSLPNSDIAPLIPSHSFAKVVWKQDEMSIAFFDYEWLEKLFKQRKIRLKHEVIDDETIVLTASSEELQQFVQKYADEEDAYISPTELLRAQ